MNFYIKVLVCSLIGYNLFIGVNSFRTVPDGVSRFQQHHQFGEGVRDWFRNVRDKIRGCFGRTETTTMPPAVMEDFQQQQGNRFLVDLSKTNFNPNKDWGVRMGNWYLIKKGDNSPNDAVTEEYHPGYTTTIHPVRHTEEYEPFDGVTSSSIRPNTGEIETFEHTTKVYNTPSIQPNANTEEIETIEHGSTVYTTFTSTLPSLNTEEIETSEHGTTVHTIFTSTPLSLNTETIETTEYGTKEYTSPEMTTKVSNNPNQESYDQDDDGAITSDQSKFEGKNEVDNEIKSGP